jgi:hypothetical protein
MVRLRVRRPSSAICARAAKAASRVEKSHFAYPCERSQGCSRLAPADVAAVSHQVHLALF